MTTTSNAASMPESMITVSPPKSRRLIQRLGLAVLVITTSIAVVYPFYWMVMSSFAPEGSSLASTFVLIPDEFNGEAYVSLFARRPIFTWIWNTLLVTGISTALAIPVSLLAAYSLNRFRFRGRMGFIFFILSAQLLPATAILVPLFVIFQGYRLLNTLHGVTIAYMTFMLPMAIWVLWGYLQSIPIEFEEAALVDGCTQLGAFRRVTVPLAIPGIAATTLFCFLEGWNQYILAYVLTSGSDRWVISLGLFSFISEYNVYTEQMMAASVVASVPALVIFVLLQRYLRGGLTLGGLRG